MSTDKPRSILFCVIVIFSDFIIYLLLFQTQQFSEVMDPGREVLGGRGGWGGGSRDQPQARVWGQGEAEGRADQEQDRDEHLW